MASSASGGGSGSYGEELRRIERALVRARELVARFTPGEVAARRKSGGDPVTEADTLIDSLARWWWAPAATG